MSKTYVTTIIEDGDDLILPFPDEMLKDMNWGKGDVLEWKAHGDYATIRKIEDPTPVMRMLEGTHEVSSTQ
tara:strand:+ start:867 stop:1079 length:213 start_codon:yes stop_codon:yes gene_type:complete